VRVCFDGPDQTSYFDDWLLDVPVLSVMIMSVRFRWVLTAFLATILISCGKTQETAPPPPYVRDSNIPAPAITDTRPVIAAFGDSLSAGLGLETGRAYPDVLQKLLDSAGYRYHVVNMGVSGDTTTDGLERMPSLLAVKPAVVILEFGANDGLRGQPVGSMEKNLGEMIDALKRSGADILLAGMTLPRNYGPAYIHSFEKVYIDLARKYQLRSIPFLLEGVGGNPALTQPDGLHPTAEGADIVAHTVMKYLQPLLKKS
jgi:acyl-CoA thioesterase-1